MRLAMKAEQLLLQPCNCREVISGRGCWISETWTEAGRLPSASTMIHFLSISAGVAEKVFMEGIPVTLVKGSETEPRYLMAAL